MVPVPDDRLTLKAFLTRWLTVNLPGTIAESTEDDYNDTVRWHLIPALGQKRLSRLTVVDLDELWRAKRGAGYSTNSVRIMRTILRRALGQAESEGLIACNVAALSAPPRVRAREDSNPQPSDPQAWADRPGLSRSDCLLGRYSIPVVQRR